MTAAREVTCGGFGREVSDLNCERKKQELL